MHVCLKVVLTKNDVLFSEKEIVYCRGGKKGREKERKRKLRERLFRVNAARPLLLCPVKFNLSDLLWFVRCARRLKKESPLKLRLYKFITYTARSKLVRI